MIAETPETQPPITVRRRLRMHHLFALLIGSIIGVGWITASGLWIAQAGAVGAIIAFAGGAVLMTLIGLCYAEVMAMLPRAAGAVAYSYAAFGPLGAFWSGWMLVASYAASCAFFAITLTWLLDALLPGLSGPALYSVFGNSGRAGNGLAILLVGVVLMYANQRGAEVAGGLQTIVVIIKGALALALGAAALGAGSAVNLSPLLIGSSPAKSSIAIFTVMLTTPFWFAGFDVLPQALRECQPDVRLSHLGRLIIFTTAVALGFYAMIILAASSLVPRSMLLSFQLPTFDAFRTAFHGTVFPYIVLALGIVGVLSAWNAMLFAGSRVLNAMSAAGLAPAAFASLSPRSRTPTHSIWWVGAVGCGLGLLGQEAVDPLISAASITLVSTFVIVCLALLKLRQSRPTAERPYRLPTSWLARLATALSVALLLISAIGPLLGDRGHLPVEWKLVGVWTVLGVLYRRRLRRGQNCPSDETIQRALGSA